jgi:transcriptional regulator with XRE-family HTH domain
MDDTLSIGERLRILRIRKRLDQAEVAATLGVSRAQIGKWERDGSVPDLNAKIKLARLFNQPLDTFCSEDDLVDLRTALEVGIRGTGPLTSGSDEIGCVLPMGPTAYFDDVTVVDLREHASHITNSSDVLTLTR